ncbi:hypothetical protein D7030_10300 [Flavobacteriaceae bacterium AU392]|nr:hypothetical protein D1817_06510 [Flavobacteriaceae bacterium]RKM83678.1 hypothetical protein D7030_10300 [Flavobacteriaceae bacterium AU392]
MSRIIKSFVLTLILAILLSQFLPWWSVMLASFISGFSISLKKASVFFTPFLSIAVFWMGYAWYLGSNNDFILAKKIAVLLPLNGNSVLLLLITGIIGGVAAGMSGFFATECRKLFKK